MPTSSSAKKRVRQDAEKRTRNRARQSRMRRQVKKARQALEGADATTAEAAISQTARVLDKTARKRVIHPRKAARLKSRLAKKLNGLKQKPAE